MLTDFIIDAITKLKSIAEKDNKYIPITSHIEGLLNEINETFLSFSLNHQKINTETNKIHIENKKSLDDTMRILKESYDHLKKEIDSNISLIDSTNQERIESLVNKTSELKFKLDSEIQILTYNFEKEKQELSQIKSKEISYINKTSQQIKKQSSESISQIEINHDFELKIANEAFLTAQKSILDNIANFKEAINNKKQDIYLAKNSYREQSDSKYLAVKNDYHLASSIFNKEIDKLKKYKTTHLESVKKSYNDNLEPLLHEIEILQKDNVKVKNELLELFEQSNSEIKNKNAELIVTFNEKKSHILKETSEAITLLNSKLSAYKESLFKDRQDEQKLYKQKLLELKSEHERNALLKERNKEIRIQDNELNKHIIRTSKETQIRLRDQYNKLYQLEIDFLNSKSKLRIDEKMLLINYKLQSYHYDQKFHLSNKEIDTKLKKLKLTYEYEIELVNQKHLEQIAPHEKTLSIANAVSERDVNLLSNETNYHLNHYQYKEDSLVYNQNIYVLEQEHLLSKEEISLETKLAVLELTRQLNTEKEHVIRDTQLKNQTLKEELINQTYISNLISKELVFLLRKLEIENTIEFTNKEDNFIKTFYKNESNILVEEFNFKLLCEEFKTRNYSKLEKAKVEIDSLHQDLNVIHSRIHYLFNQIYVIYNIHHHFMLELINLYKIPAHPEHVKEYISLYLEVFKHLTQILESSKDEFLIDVSNYHQTKINDIINQNIMSYKLSLEHKQNDDLNILDLEEYKLQSQINKFENQNFFLGQKVDKIQSQINQLEISLTLDENKKNARQIRQEIDVLLKQIDHLEKEMNTLDEEIIKLESPLKSIDDKRELLKNKATIDLSKFEKTENQQAKELISKVHFYKSIMKQLTTLFKTFETKVEPLINRLNQPIYITDNMMEDYQKSYSKFENFFELQSNKIYQSLLKGSIKLFNELIDEQNELIDSINVNLVKENVKNEKVLSSFRKQKEALLLKYNHDREQMAKEKLLVFEQRKNNISNDKSIQLTESKAQISNLEKQIMSSEEKLKSELILIEDNLNSVITQLQNDNQKNILKITENYNKSVNKLTESIDHKKKNLELLEESTSAKNNILQQKYTQTELKLEENHKIKLQDFKTSIEKKTQILEKKIEQFNQEYKTASIKQQKLLSTQKKKSQTLANNMTRFENNRNSKELKDVKKSYQYKQKTLNL